MNEEASKTSWTESGSMDDLLKSFEDFPPWIKDTFKYAGPALSIADDADAIPSYSELLRAWVSGNCAILFVYSVSSPTCACAYRCTFYLRTLGSLAYLGQGKNHLDW